MNISQAFVQSVRNSIAKGNHARWGEVESTNAIVAAVKASVMESGLDEAEATAIGDVITPFVRRVVNPSQFAQSCEMLPDGSGLDADGKVETVSYDATADKVVLFAAVGQHIAHPAYIRRPKRGSGGAKAGVSV